MNRAAKANMPGYDTSVGLEEDSKDTHLSPCLFFFFFSKNDTNTYYITVCLIGQRILGHFN